MMLSTLTTIADTLLLGFYYGEFTAFNIAVDSAPPEQTILYHENYVSGVISEDLQGAWEPSYTLRLWLLSPSGGLNDKPFDHAPRLASLEALMYQVLNKLGKGYTIKTPVNFSEGVNVKTTNKNLDGITFIVNCVARVPQNVIC